MVQSIICFTDLSVSFWGYALETAAYILNKIPPTKYVASIPYEIWNDKRLSLKHLKIWGCLAYVKNIEGHKLSARSDKYRFVGYPKESIGYYYHPTQQKIFVSRYAIFLKLFKMEAMGG